MGESSRAALVTGSASGIGSAAAVALARAGYDVAVNYSRSEDAARDTAAQCEAAGKEHGIRTIIQKCDVADDGEVNEMVEACRAAFGRLDVLVTKAASPLLKAAKGCIVNTASIVGLRPGPQPLAYSASKASVVSLTKTLALALAPDVRVNAVAPGWMEGDWMERMLGDNYDKMMDRRARMTPLGRCVTAEDVAESMMSFVEGNRFVTGEILVVDGGFASVT